MSATPSDLELRKEAKACFLDGHVVAATGKVYGVTRYEVHDQITAAGGLVAGSITSKVTMVIAEPGVGEWHYTGKAQKAKERGIPVLRYNEYLNKLEEFAEAYIQCGGDREAALMLIDLMS